MEVILGIVITSLFWAICFFLYLAEKNKHDALKTHEEVRKLREENHQLRNGQNIEYPPSGNNVETLRLENSLREKDNKIQNLEETLANREKKILQLSNDYNDAKVEALRLSNVLREQDKGISKSKGTIYEKENEILRLNNVLHERDKEISKLKNTVRDKDNKISRLNIDLREKDNEILRLRRFPQEKDENVYKVTYLEGELYQKKVEITKLEEVLREKDAELARLKKTVKPTSPSTPTGKRFISVKFYKNASDKFDYFMGKISGLKIGDRVMVPVKGILKPATVCYISKLGETSEYANSEIVSKIDERTQTSLFD